MSDGGRIGINEVDALFDAMFAKELVGMHEATEAYARVVVPGTRISDSHRDCLAQALCRQLTLYSVSDGGASVRPIAEEELRRGRFMDGARVLVFRDGRDPIRDLAVARSALSAAIAAPSASGTGESHERSNT